MDMICWQCECELSPGVKFYVVDLGNYDAEVTAEDPVLLCEECHEVWEC